MSFQGSPDALVTLEQKDTNILLRIIFLNTSEIIQIIENHNFPEMDTKVLYLFLATACLLSVSLQHEQDHEKVCLADAVKLGYPIRYSSVFGLHYDHPQLDECSYGACAWSPATDRVGEWITVSAIRSV